MVAATSFPLMDLTSPPMAKASLSPVRTEVTSINLMLTGMMTLDAYVISKVVAPVSMVPSTGVTDMHSVSGTVDCTL